MKLIPKFVLAPKCLLTSVKALPLLPLIMTSPAIAQDKELPKHPSLSLYERFSGNTVTGYNTGDVEFTEFHSPDGRIFGYNGGEPAINACWRTSEPDIVCYYYGEDHYIKGEFCWRFEPIGDLGYKLNSMDSSTIGMAKVEAGNPHNLNDHGKSWTCDALMSSARPLGQSLIAHVQEPLP